MVTSTEFPSAEISGRVIPVTGSSPSPLREGTDVEALLGGDRLSTTPPEPAAGTEFVSTDEIIARQGVAPLRSVHDLVYEDPFSSDEEYGEFLTDLYDSRRASAPTPRPRFCADARPMRSPILWSGRSRPSPSCPWAS